MNNERRPVIAVDIDDVIAANAEAFVNYSNEKYGTQLTIDDYQDHWGDVWNVDHDEVAKRAIAYHDSGYIAQYQTIPGAQVALRQLKERFSLVVLTARRNSINVLTKEWINLYYPDTFDDFVFTGFYDTLEKGAVHLTKGELAKRIQADYLIDDQLKHVLAAAELGIQGLLFGNYSWNKIDTLPDNVIRTPHWSDVLEYFASQ